MNFKWVHRGEKIHSMNWVFLLQNVPCRFLWLSKHPRAFLDNQGLNPEYLKKKKDEGKIISHAFLYFTGVAACPLKSRSHEDSYPKKKTNTESLSMPPFAASDIWLGQTFPAEMLVLP